MIGLVDYSSSGEEDPFEKKEEKKPVESPVENVVEAVESSKIDQTIDKKKNAKKKKTRKTRKSDSTKRIMKKLGISMDDLLKGGSKTFLDENDNVDDDEKEESILKKRKRKHIVFDNQENEKKRRKTLKKKPPSLPMELFNEINENALNDKSNKIIKKPIVESNEDLLERKKREYNEYRNKKLAEIEKSKNLQKSTTNDVQGGIEIIDVSKVNANKETINYFKKHQKIDRFRKELFDPKQYKVLQQGSVVHGMDNQLIKLAKDAARKELEYHDIRGAGNNSKKDSWKSYGW